MRLAGVFSSCHLIIIIFGFAVRILAQARIFENLIQNLPALRKKSLTGPIRILLRAGIEYIYTRYRHLPSRLLGLSRIPGFNLADLQIAFSIVH